MNATTCPDHNALEAYLLGNIDDDAIDAHLDECADCRSALDELDAAVNEPFACLRQPAAAPIDWQAPYQLIAKAERLLEGSVDLDDRKHKPRSLPYQLGDYLLLELVAQSGMGQVYKALHVHLKKTVAVKLIAPWLVSSSAGRERFRREMEAVGRLDSPHIVSALDAGEADGVAFLVMEYLDGCDFGQFKNKHGVLPITQAIGFILQAARGLEVAHAAGIVHRDVKPANLMVDANGTVKVLDLGLAMLPFQEQDSSNGYVIGTPAYIAPEQAIDLNAADERTDIYGLAGTLHFLLTGHPPYWPSQGMGWLDALREQPVPSLRNARSDCPRALDALFRRMLAKDPKDRPPSMREVIAELERIARPRRSFGWRGLIAASVALAASALLAFAFWAGAISGEQKKDDTTAKVAEPKKGAKPAIDMVRIAAGEFWMGGSDSDPRAKPTEKPRRKVKINRAFFLGKTELTQAEYEEVIGSNPSAFSAKGANKARVKGLDTSKHPVESVSWLDAVRFCNRLSERHELKPYYKINGEVVTIHGGDGYRLPTEAEWEYACRAGTTTTWSFGEKSADLKDHAWYAENSDDRTHPVAQKTPNPWGLYDMYGNVPEWCWDRYDPDYYAYMPKSDPPGSGTGRLRVFRGDGWNSLAPRTPAREGLGFTYGSAGSINIVGFRVARNAEP